MLISTALAAVIAIASMPLMYAVVVCDSRCALTLDICHPVQSAASSVMPLLAPPPVHGAHPGAGHEWRRAPLAVASSMADRPADTPDPPPPKS